MKPNVIQYPENKKIGDYREIWLAGGCFWGTEKYLAQLDGVLTTAVGYANGNTIDPTYQEVCTGTTSYAEAVYIQYDHSVITLSFLLDVYYKSIDPHSLNRQGGDVGTQYRTGIYYTRSEDKPIILESLECLEKERKRPIAIEVELLENFYLAEDYHQEYLDKNPGGYCHIPPSLFEYAARAKDPNKKRP